jgi:hypothetical protein
MSSGNIFSPEKIEFYKKQRDKLHAAGIVVFEAQQAELDRRWAFLQQTRALVAAAKAEQGAPTLPHAPSAAPCLGSVPEPPLPPSQELASEPATEPLAAVRPEADPPPTSSTVALSPERVPSSLAVATAAATGYALGGKLDYDAKRADPDDSRHPLDEGRAPRRGGNRGDTALHAACWAGHLTTAKAFSNAHTQLLRSPIPSQLPPASASASASPPPSQSQSRPDPPIPSTRCSSSAVQILTWKATRMARVPSCAAQRAGTPRAE